MGLSKELVGNLIIDLGKGEAILKKGRAFK